MPRDRDDILDIDGLPDPRGPQPPGAFRPVAPPGRGERNWLAVHWRCCHVYSRIYKTRDGRSYAGRCPRCGRPVRAHIGPEGTNARFFEAR